MDGTKNLMVPRGDKSVWDKPSLSASLSSYDQERWLAAAWGSALVMVGARRGGFGGGLMAMLGTTLTIRAAMGRHDLHVARRWLDRTLADRGYSRQGRRVGRVGGVVPGKRFAGVDRRFRRNSPAIEWHV